jgi:FkbM family methyltransferase
MIDAYEPHTTNPHPLDTNCQLSRPYQQIRIYSCAISNIPGTSYLHKSRDNRSDHRIYPSPSLILDHSIYIATLASLHYSNKRRPNILKIDTHGAKLDILEGASNLFKSGWHPTMVLEFWPEALTRKGHNPMNLVSKLNSLGNRSYVINPHNSRLEPVVLHSATAYTRSLSRHDIFDKHLNVLCIPTQALPQYMFSLYRYISPINV